MDDHTTLSYFYIILGMNTLIAGLNLLWGFFRTKKPKQGKLLFTVRSAVILLCPVIGLLFFLCGNFFHKLFFHKKVDLSDVIFNKEKIHQVEKSDMEREMNYAPIEETIAVSDYKNQRQLMMNVLRSDIRDSLASISLALNSQDSEVSHYAASALRDELGGFRSTVQKMHQNLNNHRTKNQSALCSELIEYMYPVLRQNIFPELEHKNYVYIMNEAFTLLCKHEHYQVKSVYYEWITEQLISVGEYSEAEKWCNIAKEKLKGQLIPYKCLLKLYYDTKDRRHFFETMEELKQSDIPIDNDTLETFRIFN